MVKKTDEQKLIELEAKIKDAEEKNLPIEKYVILEISILEKAIQSFLKQMEQEERLNSIEVAQIEIRQYAEIKALAQKINHSTEIHDEMIKNVQSRILGKENWNTFFKDN